MKHTRFTEKRDFDKFYQLPFANHFEEGYTAHGDQWYKWAGTDTYNAFIITSIKTVCNIG